MRMVSFNDNVLRIRSDDRLVAAGFKWLEEKPDFESPVGYFGDLLAPFFKQTMKVLFTIDGSIQVSKRPGKWDLMRTWRIFKWKMDPPLIPEGRSFMAIDSIGAAPIVNTKGQWVKWGIPRFRVCIYFQDGGWRDVAWDIPGPDEARLITMQLNEALKEMRAAVTAGQYVS